MSNNSLGKSFKDYYWIVSIDPNTSPKELMIELSTYCNYDCIYCFRRRWINKQYRYMDKSLATKILEEARNIGVKKISFSGWGEPLLHPHIMEIIEKAKNLGFEVLLNTNGYFLDKYIDFFYEIELDEITVSIDAPHEDVYRLIRIGGDLGKLLKTLLRLKEKKIKEARGYPRISVQFTINKYNYNNLLNMIKLAKKIGAYKLIVSNIIPLTKEIENNLACYMDKKCIEEVEKIKLDIARISIDTGIDVNLPNFNLTYSERTCPFARKWALFIRSDGLVTPCIYYAYNWKNVINGIEREIKPVILGDLKKESLKNIWLNKMVLFRFKTHYMDYPSCLDCPLQEYCTLTLDNTVDCWGNSPTCAHCPYSRDMVRCPL